MTWDAGVAGLEGHGERLRTGRCCAIAMGKCPKYNRLPSGCNWLSDDRDPLAGRDSCGVDEDGGLEVRFTGIIGATVSSPLNPGLRETMVARGLEPCCTGGVHGNGRPGDAGRLEAEPPSEEATEEGVAGRLDTSEGGGLLFSRFLSCRD